MGLRYRRSVTIIPGVRLNLTRRGLSTTLGPRGASINIGPRGTHANLGLPGTGLSVRTRLDSPPSRKAARTSYRAIQQSIREADRREAQRAAQAAHETYEHEFNRLGGILKARTRLPFDWSGAKTETPFEPLPFSPPPVPFSARAISDEARRRRPVWPWLALIGIAVYIAIAGGPFYGVRRFAAYGAAGLVGALGGLVLWWTLASRRRLRQALTRQRTAEYREAVAAAQKEHAAKEDERRYEHQLRNTFARRLAEAEATGEPEALAELLEYELSHQDLPVPLVFELDFDGIDTVNIEVSLPEISATPEERTELTKTGKLSRRKLARRDRIALFADVCASLVLRLIYETFRILPTIQRVEASGTTEDVDPATGHPREFIALHLATGRQQFEWLSLDDVDPSDALEGLGGRLGLTKAGELRPLDGIAGLRPEVDWKN